MLIISNPNAGDKSGPIVLRDVTALIERHRPSLVIDFKETAGPGNAGVLANDYLKRFEGKNEEEATILISGGDTTIHEVINQLAKSSVKHRAKIVLVPSGTANALYHSMFPPKNVDSFIRQLSTELQTEIESLDTTLVSKLYSVLFFLSNGTPRPLQSTRTSILDRQGATLTEMFSCVVVSSALHASILDIAESLRSTYPGIERFKIAAGQSITQWSRAQLVVKDVYEIYDPVSARFKQATPAGNGMQDTTRYAGPFAYFLTTTNVDRLEQEFRIAPLATTIPVTEENGWMEVVLIRPARDPAIKQEKDWYEDEAVRQTFAAKTMKALQAAYQDGAHISMAYEASGELEASVKQTENAVVEYLRVKEWEWIPDEGSTSAHLICVDGEVLRIPAGGRATSRLLAGADRVELSVYGGV